MMLLVHVPILDTSHLLSEVPSDLTILEHEDEAMRPMRARL